MRALSIHRQRRRFLRAATGLALPLSLGACGLWSDQPVAVAAHVWVGYEPMFLAQSRGWIEPQRVALLATANAQESIAALRSGRVQAAALTLDEALTIRSPALPLSIILVCNISMGADMLLAAPGISSLKALKGRRIGLEASSVANVLLSEALRVAGLRAAEVTLLRMPIEEHVALWQGGRVDALLTYEPVAGRLIGLGMQRLFDTQQLPDTIVAVLAVRQEALDNAHAGAWRHLLSGHFRAVDAITRNPQDSAYRMTKRLNLPASHVLRAFKGIELPGVAKNYLLLGGAEPPLRAMARRLLTILHDPTLHADYDDFSALLQSAYLPAEELLK